ncbi:MAG: ATP-binding protein [Pirellulaceae bacterium]
MGKPRGGILMYGPPGCGKTYLARATAGEIGAGFIAVGINDVLDMWIGNSERNLNALFDQARRNRPCVLFFDEADALGSRRSDMNSGHGRQLINQFLSEMDGVDGNNEGVLVLAATNAPWHIDPAFRRPGRFDRVLFVPPPDLEGRAEMRLQLTDKPQETIDFKTLAKTSRFLEADLKSVVDIGGAQTARCLSHRHPPTAHAKGSAGRDFQRPPVTTREWFSTAATRSIQ